MSESLLRKLYSEKPTVELTSEMLGSEILGGHKVQPGERYLSYALKTPSFYWGLDIYVLNIFFNDDGSFLSAEVVLVD